MQSGWPPVLARGAEIRDSRERFQEFKRRQEREPPFKNHRFKRRSRDEF